LVGFIEPEVEGLLKGRSTGVDVEAERGIEEGEVQALTILRGGEVIDGSQGITNWGWKMFGGSEGGTQSGIEILGREFAVEGGKCVGVDKRFKVGEEFNEEVAFDVLEGFEVREEFELRHTF
jgi:hypothetical protein